MAMRKLVYLCDWLPPDFGAVGQYAMMHAKDYALEGYEVTLIGLTSAKGGSATEEPIGAGLLRIVKIPAAPTERTSLARRLRWTLAANVALIRAAWPYLRLADEALFTGSPPFMLHCLVPLKPFLRARLIYRIADFHPECLIAAQEKPSRLLGLFLRLTLALRRRVDQFQASGEDQLRLLRSYGIADERITLKRDPSPVRFTGEECPLSPPEALRGKIILLYSGNWGVAHDVETFVEAYIQHHQHGSGRTALWLNAVGAGADEVEARLRAAGVLYARSKPAPLEELARLLITPHAHLITLRDAFVGYVIPSKTYGCIASGHHVLYIGSAASDVDLICREGIQSDQRYWRVDAGDSTMAAQRLEDLADYAQGVSAA
jgi:hypothetical protein